MDRVCLERPKIRFNFYFQLRNVSAQTIRPGERWESVALRRCYPFEAMTPYIDAELYGPVSQ